MMWDPDNVSIANSTSFKYKSSFFKSLTAGDNGEFQDVKNSCSVEIFEEF